MDPGRPCQTMKGHAERLSQRLNFYTDASRRVKEKSRAVRGFSRIFIIEGEARP